MHLSTNVLIGVEWRWLACHNQVANPEPWMLWVMPTHCLPYPINVGGDFGKDARVGWTCAGLHTPWDDADLGVQGGQQQWATRIATALTLPALGQASAELAPMQLRLMTPTALLVAEYVQLRLLQLHLQRASGLQSGKKELMVRARGQWWCWLRTAFKPQPASTALLFSSICCSGSGSRTGCTLRL